MPSIEDERGVDISQIRNQLRLSVPERVRVMVHLEPLREQLGEREARPGE